MTDMDKGILFGMFSGAYMMYIFLTGGIRIFHKWYTYEVGTFDNLPTQIMQRCSKCNRTRLVIEDD